MSKFFDDTMQGLLEALEIKKGNILLQEGNNKTVIDHYDQFGEEMPDGRLTEPSNGIKYRLREAILMKERLGRPLTDEEMRQFEYDSLADEGLS